jgi:hypothetical protein
MPLKLSRVVIRNAVEDHVPRSALPRYPQRHKLPPSRYPSLTRPSLHLQGSGSCVKHRSDGAKSSIIFLCNPAQHVIVKASMDIRDKMTAMPQHAREILTSRAAIALMGFLCLGIAFGAGYRWATSTVTAVGYQIASPSMQECVKEALDHSEGIKVSFSHMQQATAVCYQQFHQQGLLGDFYLRRMGFLQQNYADKVILWMVVLLTFSGPWRGCR